MVHKLKILPKYFEAVKIGFKTFEVRKNDRDFTLGDYMILNEYLPETGYTGRKIITEITYILNDKNYCKDGFVILGFKKN